MTCKCQEQYVGKTTVTFEKRLKEHWSYWNTSVKEYLGSSDTQPTTEDLISEEQIGPGKELSFRARVLLE